MPRTKFHINPRSEEPIHLQLREQIILMIATGELPLSHRLPSVRALGRQLEISSNTVSNVYTELVDEGWLVRRPGSRLVVVRDTQVGRAEAGQIQNLDDLINRAVLLAQERGYSLEQFAARIRERLPKQPPDHLLIVEPDKGMGQMTQEEIRQVIGYAPPTCHIFALQQNPSLAIGAVLLTPSHLLDRLEGIPAKDRTVVPLKYLSMDSLDAAIRNLSQPSVVGVLSVSVAGLRTATGLLAPAIGDRHSLCEFLMERSDVSSPDSRPVFRRYTVKEHPPTPGVRTKPQSKSIGEGPQPQGTGTEKLPLVSEADVQAVDLLICDVITCPAFKHRQKVLYRLLSDESLQAVASAAKSLAQDKRAMAKSVSAQ